jgi:hypothetical protein
MSDHELERLVSFLPGAQPPAELRARILKARPSPAGRRALALRPALAVLTFVLLVLAEVAAMSWQTDAWASARRSERTVVAAELLEQQRELGLERTPLVFVSASSPSITAAQASSPDSYISLRRRLDPGA